MEGSSTSLPEPSPIFSLHADDRMRSRTISLRRWAGEHWSDLQVGAGSMWNNLLKLATAPSVLPLRLVREETGGMGTSESELSEDGMESGEVGSSEAALESI